MTNQVATIGRCDLIIGHRFSCHSSFVIRHCPQRGLLELLDEPRAPQLPEEREQGRNIGLLTGEIGDGKIFLSRIDDAIRIRNDERGESVL